MYHATDTIENLRLTRSVVAILRTVGHDPHEAIMLALLGGLPGLAGAALLQAAAQPLARQALAQFALGSACSPLPGGFLTVEEAFAWVAALGYDPSPIPVAFHCPEDGCHARAHFMIDRLRQLGIPPDHIRKVWAIAARVFNLSAPKLQPIVATGLPLLDYKGAVIGWDYHVAPAVLVHLPTGNTDWCVLDPALFA